MGKDDSSPLIGRTIAGKFAIEAHLGGGAMGAVFRARQVALDKTVAIKVLHSELSKDPMFAARFLREAKAASRIDHANSMRVIDFGEEPDGVLYMAMEYLDGKDLFTVLKTQWPMSALRIVDILGQVLAALAVAHDMGVVHRDLKPENIMVLQGHDDEGLPKDIVKVCDFGIAKLTNKRSDLSQSEGPRLTTAGLVVGTPEYMSPEQGRGEPLDARSDLYSIGVILFQMLTNKVPFEAETALGIVLKHVTDDPPPPSSMNPAIDTRLESICMKAMRKKREDRYQSAREMRADLRGVLDLGAQSLPLSLPKAAASQPRLELLDPTPSMENAATAVAIDSAAVRAGAASSAASASSASGSGRPGPATETALEAVIPKSPRWPGFAIAALLLAATGGIIATRVVGPLAPTSDALDAGPTASATPLDPTHANTSPTAVGQAPSAVPAFGSAEPASSKGAHLAHDGRPLDVAAAIDAGLIEEAPVGPSASASASAPKSSGPSSSASAGPASSTVPPAQSTAPAASAAPSAAAATPYDPSKARVVLGAIHPLNTTAEDVQKELNVRSLSQCYASTLLGTATKPATAHVTMHLETDDAGRVNAAELTGDKVPPAAGNCVMKSMMGKVIRGADGSGIASANVALTFLPD